MSAAEDWELTRDARRNNKRVSNLEKKNKYFYRCQNCGELFPFVSGCKAPLCDACDYEMGRAKSAGNGANSALFTADKYKG